MSDETQKAAGGEAGSVSGSAPPNRKSHEFTRQEGCVGHELPKRLVELLAEPERAIPPRLWRLFPPEAREKAALALLEYPEDAIDVQLLRDTVARDRNFRPVTVAGWEPAKVARHARWIHSSPGALLVALLRAFYLGPGRAIPAAYLDYLGVPHENGRLDDTPEDLDPEQTRHAADQLLAAHDPTLSLIYLLALRTLTPELVPGLDAWFRDRAEAASTEGAGDPADERHPGDAHAPAGEAPDEAGLSPTNVEHVLDRADQFTTLDRLLIRTIVDAAQGVEGALDPDEVDDLLKELVQLNSNRHRTFFHVGFADAVLHEPHATELPAENEARREWYWSGVVSGLARQENWSEIVRLFDEIPPVRNIGKGTEGPAYSAAPLIFRALVEEERYVQAAAALTPFTVAARGFRFLRDVLWTGTELVRRQRPDDALPLLDLARNAARFMEHRGEEVPRVTSREIERRRAHCYRQLGRFEEARELLTGLLEPRVRPYVRSMIQADLGLIEGGFRTLADVRMPRDQAHVSEIIDALERGAEYFEAGARGGTRTSAHGHYCLGVLAMLKRPWREAGEHLQRAVSGFEADPPRYSYGGLLSTARLYLGMSILLTLDTPRAEHAVSLIRRGLEEGAVIPTYLLSELLDAAEMMAGAELEELVNAILEHGGADFLDLILETPAAVKTRTAVEVLRQRAMDPARKQGQRVRDLVRVIPLLLEHDPDEAARCLDELEGLAMAGVEPDAALDLLSDPDNFEPVWSREDARWAQINLLEQTGRLDVALGLLSDAFHQAVTARTPHSLAEAAVILDRIQELGVEPVAYEHLRPRLESVAEGLGTVEVEEGDELPLVRVLFVGGDEERQTPLQDRVRDYIAQRDPAVEVEFEHPGWGSNWGGTVEQIASRLNRYDCVVLMRFMRTEFGRQLRARLGDTPWVFCSGSGVQRMAMSILSAARVARERIAGGDGVRRLGT